MLPFEELGVGHDPREREQQHRTGRIGVRSVERSAQEPPLVHVEPHELHPDACRLKTVTLASTLKPLTDALNNATASRVGNLQVANVRRSSGSDSASSSSCPELRRAISSKSTSKSATTSITTSCSSFHSSQASRCDHHHSIAHISVALPLVRSKCTLSGRSHRLARYCFAWPCAAGRSTRSARPRTRAPRGSADRNEVQQPSREAKRSAEPLRSPGKRRKLAIRALVAPVVLCAFFACSSAFAIIVLFRSSAGDFVAVKQSSHLCNMRLCGLKSG